MSDDFHAMLDDWFSNLPSLEQLTSIVGELSEEEIALFRSIDFSDNLDPALLQAYGPDFTERVQILLFGTSIGVDEVTSVIPQLPSPRSIGAPSADPSLIALMEILAEMEIASLLGGYAEPRLSRKLVEALESTADVLLASSIARTLGADDQ